ncbi:MAG TPA: hypothetical protein VFA65_06825 [Bryobacteraceae bacterium]|nr:hypothetical protein [Bryobacteraceae bacterium]
MLSRCSTDFAATADKFAWGYMPELVRYALPPVNDPVVDVTPTVGRLTRRERRLYVALAVILSLNLTVICGVVTFFSLMFGS